MSQPELKPLDTLLNPSQAIIDQESRLPGGYIPERWVQIEQLESIRMTTRMGQSLQERKQSWTEKEVAERRDIVERYFKDLMLPPSFEGGAHASRNWLNLPEMLTRVIDLQKDEEIVPDVDGRVPFKSMGLEKSIIITHWLINQVQSALPTDNQLSDAHLKDCFTNVSQEQLNVVTEQIAQSGLTLLPESPSEHWSRIVKEHSSRQDR